VCIAFLVNILTVLTAMMRAKVQQTRHYLPDMLELQLFFSPRGKLYLNRKFVLLGHATYMIWMVFIA
jgi:hypothetical protein